GGIVLQDDDPFMLIGNAKFVARADHRVAGYAAYLAGLQLPEELLVGMAIKENCTTESQNDFLAAITHFDVWLTRHHILRLGGAICDGSKGQATGIGTPLDRENLGNDDLVPLPDRGNFFLIDPQSAGVRQTN